jgi:predicted acetyltransferase
VTDYIHHPIDETSHALLRERGLSLTLVDHADQEAWNAWYQADARGFLGSRASGERVAEAHDLMADRRTTGVYDDAGEAAPVATAQSWITPLTAPGLTAVPSWAISSVSVAATHRRRGIASALLTAELRTASALGVPLAILTVSESTIYHRFGFGPATWLTAFEVDTKRERWRGRDVDGRLSYVDDPVTFRAEGAAVLERVRRDRVGEIAKSPFLVARLSGPLSGDPKKDDHRVVRVDDAEGVCQGFVVYTLTAHESDFAMHTLDVEHLVAATDDAYLALWRFVIEHDLVGLVRTSTSADDEPLPHLLTDFRQARQVRRNDQLWLRVLDVPRALEGRRYERDGSIVLRVDDPLGFAEGVWRLVVRDGVGSVEAVETDGGGEPDVSLAATALGSLYLGGARARDLALREELAGDAAAVDRLFRTDRPPYFASWF